MAGAGAPQHATKQLAKPQVQSIRNEANDTQRAQPWNKNKSRAEAVLRRLCGSAMMAKVIWQVGLPNISEAGFAMEKVLPATEQQRATEQLDKLLSFPECTLRCLGADISDACSVAGPVGTFFWRVGQKPARCVV